MSADWSFLFVCLAFISTPHVLYVWLWTVGHKLWMKIFGDKSVSVFAAVASGLKIVQFSAAAAWYMNTAPKSPGLLQNLLQLNPLVILAALGMLGFGQLLNIAIYQRIGKAGVYYGCRLGEQIPWVEGFPFNIVGHPQYVGSALSVWGVYLLTCLRGGDLQTQGCVGALAVTLFYAVNAVVEQFHNLPSDAPVGAPSASSGASAGAKKVSKKVRKAD